ncbi:dihydroorotate dehydrogenase [Dermatobacter hominis]|uniref:dihydroorotate dehydrogenase n=1 Tax=Dermatobacter hominis TaxID=2884263 RepID=UPI001D11B2F3|nr:dihydroorotate dehydrogenase [Dermatobacter hominis]UDY36196.1 dihydroorotate dehydrogenase [Dermatobacter hominis]
MALRRRGRRRPDAGVAVDLSTTVGSVALKAPVMTASGTAGHGDELAAYVDLSTIGAVVVKSLGSGPWPGNPAPRVHPTPSGMINSVGLQGPGVTAWRERELPAVLATGATVVASIWGRHVDDFASAAEQLAGVDERVVALEVNLSCPNLDGGAHLFAHDPDATAAVLRAAAAAGLPMWAKLSANTDRVVDVAAAAHEAGAEAVTLANTLMGMVIDVDTRRPVLGAGGGGVSGPAIHPVAVRTVYDVRAALPEVPIVGVGGVVDGRTAVELLLAGASAVQVGTASFADPRSVGAVLEGVETWCSRAGVTRVRDLIGGAHG